MFIRSIESESNRRCKTCLHSSGTVASGTEHATLATLPDDSPAPLYVARCLSGDLLNNAIASSAADAFWNVRFPTSSLGNQLKMIARLIQARSALGMKRQIFFASVGGYDTHTSQVGNAASPDDTTIGSHANLLGEVSRAVFAFQRAIDQLDVGDQVTAFTAGDFGRTIPDEWAGERPRLGKSPHDHRRRSARASHLRHLSGAAGKWAG
jgi:uncharacterized protein (DUF1501 family)